MKKFVSILLCVALLCSMVVVVAHADETPQVSIASATVLPGTTVTLDINVENNPGIASLGLDFYDEDGLEVTYAGADNPADTLGLTANDAAGKYFWVGAYDVTTRTMGTITLTIPETAAPGEYTFNVAARDSVTTSNTDVEIEDATFTITVANEIITGVNVAIDAGLAIGIHVKAINPDEASITAVNVAKKEYATIEDYEAGEEEGEYIYYLNINPWAMDEEYLVDFTGNFKIGEDEFLSLEKLPESARTIGILSYCEALLAGEPSEELVQLIADMLEYGRQAQIYQLGYAEDKAMALPAGLAATEAAWEDSNGDPCDFGTFCSENFPEDLTPKNANAKKRFKFDSAEISFGAKFKVTFTLANNGTTTAFNLAKIKVDGTTYALSDETYEYAFNPAQYGGVEFDLYSTSTTATNFCWINVYGPAHYAAYAYENGAGEDLMTVFEAFYNYGVSAEAYAATLGE